MSEFKFACPVCGQHITADSKDSGGQLECPTCFRKIVVPQAPASTDPKFILAASQVGKPRPLSTQAPSESTALPLKAKDRRWVVAMLLVVGVAAAGAMGYWAWRARSVHGPTLPEPQAPTAREVVRAPAPPKPVHAAPTNFEWSLTLSNAAYPETAAAGSLRGAGFLCERSLLQGGLLTLRQGKKGTPELSVTIHLFAEQAEELNGKTIEIGAERKPPQPKITLRWKNDDQKAGKEEFKSGYVLRLAFAQAANQRMAGKIYLCLPDEGKSFVAGTFDAEIRKAQPPKPKPPAQKQGS